ncbi:hypothetical protein CEK60_01645 [Halomonas sp. N3-2A]|nr:hypothetical protein CEK60_01645 [Halomonas sp. N3-2A]
MTNKNIYIYKKRQNIFLAYTLKTGRWGWMTPKMVARLQAGLVQKAIKARASAFPTRKQAFIGYRFRIKLI